MSKKKRVVSEETRKKISVAVKARYSKKPCLRHPEVMLAHKENCQRCINQCSVHNALMANKKFILPCPKCKNSTREEDGGCIKTFYSKANHYGCGNCRISYNLKGEQATWESGQDQDLLNKEILYRK